LFFLLVLVSPPTSTLFPYTTLFRSFVASPVVLYQVWMFISPGLYRHEKRYVLPFMFSTVGLFMGGGFFGYKIVYPGMLNFLVGYAQQFQPMITVSEYTDLFLTVIIGLGIIFVLPILF